MLCDNCRKKEANVRYSENINGIKKELNLCEECSRRLGIGNIDFNIPINFSSFFGDFMENFVTMPELMTMPVFDEIKKLKCNYCGFTFEDIVNHGKLGCGNCYEVFEERLDPIIRRIQGANYHVGRVGKIIDSKTEKKLENNKEIKQNQNKNKLEELQEELKQCIKEERYEEAAKIRDKIKRIRKIRRSIVEKEVKNELVSAK